MNTEFKIVGVTDKFVPMARQEHLYEIFGLDTNGLKRQMISLMGIKNEQLYNKRYYPNI